MAAVRSRKAKGALQNLPAHVLWRRGFGIQAWPPGSASPMALCNDSVTLHHCVQPHAGLTTTFSLKHPASRIRARVRRTVPAVLVLDPGASCQSGPPHGRKNGERAHHGLNRTGGFRFLCNLQFGLERWVGFLSPLGEEREIWGQVLAWCKSVLISVVQP